MRLRENFGVDEPQIDDLAYESGPSDIPPAPPRRYFAEGGYADVGAPIPGSGLPADQVQLQTMTPKDLKVLARMPDFARQQQEVTLARYGGKAINGAYLDEETGQVKGPPFEKPPEEAGRGGMPGYDRNRFEQVVFKEIGGNPFDIDVMREVDRVTAAELPKLFSQVFRGQAIWEDRGRLNSKQQAFWQDELKRFRAHVKDRIDSERQQKVGMYKFMMDKFDTEAKETEAARKRVLEKEKEFLTTRKDTEKEARLQQKDDQAYLEKLQSDKRQILKRQSEIIKEGTDLKTGAMTPEAEAEFTQLADHLKYINANTQKLMMKLSPEYRTEQAKKMVPSETAAAHAPTKPKPKDENSWDMGETPAPAEKPPAKGPEVVKKKLPGAAETGFKFAKHPKGNPVEVRRHKSGRLMGRMEDGSIVWLNEEGA